jgi:hypothetical protein
MLVDEQFSTQKEASETVLRLLHEPLLTTTPLPGESTHTALPSDALRRLTVLLANINPSPNAIVSLLAPLVTSLYSLLLHLDKIKTSDPELKENLRNILLTWGRITTTIDGVHLLWKIITGDRGFWKITVAGDIMRIER